MPLLTLLEPFYKQGNTYRSSGEGSSPLVPLERELREPFTLTLRLTPFSINDDLMCKHPCQGDTLSFRLKPQECCFLDLVPGRDAARQHTHDKSSRPGERGRARLLAKLEPLERRETEHVTCKDVHPGDTICV